jgi:hypothetical protein
VSEGSHPPTLRPAQSHIATLMSQTVAPLKAKQWPRFYRTQTADLRRS